jgi:pimeloyl-ACP methyl ester carboxylesterase
MARHGRDIGELLEHLDLSDATLVGGSMGGNAIWAYLDQYGPDRLRAIVIVDQTPRMLNSPGWPYGFYGYEASNAGRFFATAYEQLAAGVTGRSRLLSSGGSRSGSAVHRPTGIRPLRRRSSCSTITCSRTGGMLSSASGDRC